MGLRWIDPLIFAVIVPLLSIPCLLLWTYKQILLQLSNIFELGLIPLSTNDVAVSTDSFAKGQNLLQNVGWVLRVQGPVSLNWLREKFSKSFLENDARGDYSLFHTRLVQFGGYTWRKPVPNLDLKAYIHEDQLGPTELEGLDEYIGKWLGSPFREEAAPWEIALIPIPVTGETVLVYRIHHSLSDGYTMINLLDTLTGRKSPYLVKDFGESVLDRIKLAIQAPRLSYNYANEMGAVTIERPLPIAKTTDPALISFTSFRLSDFQTIRRATGAHFMSIFLSLEAGVTRRLALEKDGKVQDYTYSMVSLPWPRHPKPKMCNHWTLSHFRIPLRSSDPLERLHEIEGDFTDLHDKGIHRVMRRYLFKILSLLPTAMLKKALEGDLGVQTGWTSLVGSKDEAYDLNGSRITSIHPVLGLTCSNIGMVGFAFSHLERLDCALVVSREVGRDQDGVDKMLKVYFKEELEILLEAVKQK